MPSEKKKTTPTTDPESTPAPGSDRGRGRKAVRSAVSRALSRSRSRSRSRDGGDGGDDDGAESAVAVAVAAAGGEHENNGYDYDDDGDGDDYDDDPEDPFKLNLLLRTSLGEALADVVSRNGEELVTAVAAGAEAARSVSADLRELVDQFRKLRREVITIAKRVVPADGDRHPEAAAE